MSAGEFADGLVGIVLDGRYRLDAVLGEGGMGAVFRATHLAMDRKVAVKLLKPHLTQDEAALQRFAREARSTLKVDSPHAVKVLDFGITPHRDYYMVLEYLDGRTVQRELDVDGPFAPARVLHIAKQAARALGAAHDSGLVHRDIKPDNLLVMRVGDDPDFTKVLDFGVAKLMEGAARSTRSQLSITQAGMVFGTPEFMSPEQACGQALDGRSDLYSLAATMFAMLTGRGLFVASAAIEWLIAHARQPPPHLADGLAELEPLEQLDALIQRCLAKHPADRPQSAKELIDAIDALDAGPDRAPLPSRAPTAATASHRPVMAVSTFSPSSFIPALELSPPAPSPSPSTGEVIVASRGRGTWFVLGSAAIAGLVVLAIVLAATHAKRPDAPPPPIPAKVVVAPPAAPADATEIDAASAAGDVHADAGIAPIQHPPPSKTSIEVAKLIAEAEAAKQAGRRLRWISQADSALHLDPKNVRAKLLLAEGLIADGDTDHGCKYLRELGRNPTAIQLLRASCGGGD